ncbi:MAG TPA: hypothetical protein VFW35_09440 [Sphingomicrobium sp.]|nr:hypothetical protein [Sphingomicrobium sp.]
MAVRQIISSAGAITFLLTLSPAYAADSIRQSVLFSSALQPGPETGADGRILVHCDAGKSLVGLGVNHTDRMVGYWYRCAANTGEGLWDPNNILTFFGKGKLTGTVVGWHDCPQDYYIVGLGVTGGHYTADSHGLAEVTPAPMIADLQPLCRRGVSPIAVYQTQRSYFENAENNSLFDVPAQSPAASSPKACAPGTVAVGILFAVDFRRDIDPNNVFRDAALICDHLSGLTLGPPKTTYSPH